MNAAMGVAALAVNFRVERREVEEAQVGSAEAYLYHWCGLRFDECRR